MKGRWVVVADSASARFFAQTREGLVPVGERSHAESAEHSRDLMGNRPNANQHHMEKALKGDEPTSLRDDESRAFARDLADTLATAHARNQFSELVLVADPRFLGMLRAVLKKPVSDCVTLTLNQRAVDLRPEEVSDLLEGDARG